MSHKKIWAEADAVYLAHWVPWSYEQCLLFADYTFGFLQRKTPANIGAAIDYGTENLLAKMRQGINVLPPRAKRKDGIVFYRVDDSLRSSFLVVSIYGEADDGWSGLWLRVARGLDELCRTKTSYFGKLKERLEKAKPTHEMTY